MLTKMSLAGLFLLLIASGHVHETAGCVFARRALKQAAEAGQAAVRELQAAVEGHAVRDLQAAPKPVVKAVASPKPPAPPRILPKPPAPKGAQAGPVFNTFITTGLTNSATLNATMYKEMEDRMWRFLQNSDFVDTCNSPSICPCQPSSPGAPLIGTQPQQCTRTLTGNVCGAQSRVWFRVMFHDAGTFDKTTGAGGLDGSIQYELTDRADNPFQGFFNFYTNFYAQYGGRASMSDIIVLAAYVGLFKCGGPKVPFVPGRKDATAANAQNMLPATTDSVQTILDKFSRMGFDAGQTVALIGAGHTIAAARGQKLDTTPDKYDVNFFKQLLTTPITAPSTIPSDVQLLASTTTKGFMTTFANNKATWDTTTIAALDKLSWLGQTKPAASG